MVNPLRGFTIKMGYLLSRTGLRSEDVTPILNGRRSNNLCFLLESLNLSGGSRSRRSSRRSSRKSIRRSRRSRS